MTIRAKLIANSVLTVMTALTFSGIFFLDSLQEELSEKRTDSVRAQLTVWYALQAEINQYLEETTELEAAQSEKTELETDIHSSAERIDRLFAALKLATSDEVALAHPGKSENEAESEADQSRVTLAEAQFRLLQSALHASAHDRKATRVLVTSLRKNIANAVRDEANVLNSAEESLKAFVGYLKFLTLTLLVVVIILGVAVSGWLNRAIMKTLLKAKLILMQTVAEIGAGDYDSEVPEGTSVELHVVTEACRQMKRKLRDTQKQLIQTSKLASLGELSAGVAHELNQPLFLIQGFAGRIRAKFEKNPSVTFAQVEDYINEIQDNVVRADAIIRHMRDFARQSERQMETLDLNHIIEKSFHLLNEQLRLRGITVEKALTSESTAICGDQNRLAQVFVNFLTNSRDAIEASPRQGTGTILVRSHVEDERVIVEISDDGCGIEEADLNRIFDPFFTTKEVGKGTGLGLSIVHGIIQEHKGTVECVSRLGEGTTFRVSFPSARALVLAAG